MERHLGRMRLIVLCIVVSVLCICATPLTAAFPVVLIGACVLRGTMQGVSQPLMYSLLSHEVAGNRHGASVGLRNAVVRLGGIIVPAVMGVAAEAYGVAASFYVVGAALLLATAGLAVAARNIR
jgi:sugar phosphate permease